MKLIRRNDSTYLPSLFNEIFGNELKNYSQKTAGVLPAVNILQDENGHTIKMAVPGMVKDNFSIEAKDDLLTISFDKKADDSEKAKGYSRREFIINSFSRSFVLPETADAEKIKASYKDGILNIDIPVKEEAKKKEPRTIKIS